MIRYCRKTGVGAIPWSPIATGALARLVSTIMSTTRAELDADKLGAHAGREVDVEIIKRVEEVAKKKGWTMAQVTFTCCKDEITAPIIGVSSEARLKEYVEAIDFHLTEEGKSI